MSRSLLLAAVAALAIAPLASQENNARAVGALRRAFAKSARPHTVQQRREAALEGIAGLDSAPVAKVLCRAYTNLENEAAPLVERRRKLLLRDKGKEVLRFRVKLEPLRALQGSITDHVQKLESDDARRALAGVMRRERRSMPMTLRLACARSVVRGIDAKGIRTLIADASKGKNAQQADAEMRSLLLEAIGDLERKGAALGPFVVEQLEHGNPSVRRSAILACAKIRWHGALMPLVERLDDEGVGLRDLIGDSLVRLTRKQLGSAQASWRGWFAAEGAGFLRGDKRLGGGKATKVGGRKGGYWFGIPQTGKSIVYVQDNSKSMQAKLGRGKSALTRIQRSRDELCKALDALKEQQRFNIVLYANRIWQFADKLTPATKANVDKAKAWVRREKLEFGTNSYNALEQAFVLSGRSVFDRYYEAEVDTVFFLSDGAPTIQKLQGRGLGRDKASVIHAAVQRWNPLGRIAIHSVLLGQGRQARGFMKGLAEQNGGVFQHVRK